MVRVGKLFILLFLLSSSLLPGGLSAKTDLPIPRFVSIKATEVNVRTGPGLRYRIKWVLVRPGMPVEIIDEFEQWRKIRDIQGDEGWVHRSMISGKRRITIIGQDILLKESPSSDSYPAALAERGAQADLQECEGKYCLISSDSIKGWVKRAEIWGVYENEAID